MEKRNRAEYRQRDVGREEVLFIFCIGVVTEEQVVKLQRVKTESI